MPSAKEAEEIAAQHEELRTLWEAARKAADGFQKLYLQMEKDTAYPGKRSIGHYRLDLVRG